MKQRWWQIAALLYGALLLAFVLIDGGAAALDNADPGFQANNDPAHPGTLVVTKITNPRAFDHPIGAGARIRLLDESLANRIRLVKQRPGDHFVFIGTTAAGTPLRFTATVLGASAPDLSFWAYEIVAVAFTLVALVIAARRPADRTARTLVFLLFALGTVLVNDNAWLPDWATLPILVVRLAAQVLAATAGLALATTFPAESIGGVRAFLRRANLPYTIVCLATLYTSTTISIVLLHPPPRFTFALGMLETFLFFAAIATAFVIANREAHGADAKRAQWVGWTLAVGFSGSLVGTVQLALHIPFVEWEQWIPVTLVAIPLGLAYAIIRHRVVDIGFVVNRALVFGTVSAIVVVAFMILEWVLSTIAVRISHITSTSLELALALILGFSLRSIHERVDKLVDDVFFRDRHEAERALKMLAREIAYVTDPQVAVARVHAELLARTGASAAAIYVVEGPVAIRVDTAGRPLPPAVCIDDPALVRMRATRLPCDLHEVDSALEADHAFPLLVRDLVTGCVVLGAKTNGEAYAPDEVATIETVALGLGNALDALLRPAVPMRWPWNGAAQPAGRLGGLGE
ncbi:MAG TPA: hypothetical protein VGN14_00345 [Candidatus Elarobacter sp.]|jgi:hypothetical protein